MKLFFARTRNKAVILSEAQRSRRTCGCLSSSVKGTGFSPYINPPKTTRAGKDGFQPIQLSPEGNFFRICSRLFPFFVALAAAVYLTALPCAAQNADSAPQQTTPATLQPKGQVLFSRSTDENGQTTTQSGPSVQQPAAEGELAPPQVAERQAVTFTAFDLDVHLRPAAQQIAVRALLTVRNDGKTPLTRIPLQISSSLNWERIRVNG